MSNKTRYEAFCNTIYVPIYSMPWWLDAVVGPKNWDVWLHESADGMIDAAMPYYLEERQYGLYITKAPLTQNNGILFRYPEGASPISKAKFEEKVINQADEFVSNLGLAVYEQQYHPSFTNWLPFRWNGYTAETRYTYVLDSNRLSDLDSVWKSMDSKKRGKVKKGLKECDVHIGLDPSLFYSEVDKVFIKQGLSCPFSKSLWNNLYEAALANNAGEILVAATKDGQIASCVFIVWDEKSVYQLISGGGVELQHLEGKSALVWTGINEAASKGLSYDFEGSVIKRIANSNRLFGAEPRPYFRIRKVFAPEVIRMEAEQHIRQLAKG